MTLEGGSDCRRSGVLLAEPRARLEGVSGVGGCERGGERDSCPSCYGGWPQRAIARLRNSAASGHVVANAMRTLVAVSVMRAANFSSLSRMVQGFFYSTPQYSFGGLTAKVRLWVWNNYGSGWAWYFYDTNTCPVLNDIL